MKKTISRKGRKGAKVVQPVLVRPIICYGAIVRYSRSTAINPFTIAPQAREAREKYIEQWTDRAVGEKYLARKEARIVKVRIEVVPK